MNDCHYGTRISESDSAYRQRPAEYDVGSDCPRCARHWPYVCQHSGKASHSHGTSFYMGGGWGHLWPERA